MSVVIRRQLAVRATYANFERMAVECGLDSQDPRVRAFLKYVAQAKTADQEVIASFRRSQLNGRAMEGMR